MTSYKVLTVWQKSIQFGYLKQSESNTLNNLLDEIMKMLNKLIKSLLLTTN